MDNILISVLIPIYGVEEYIERCVRSLLEQTLKENIEFIFVDDCTKDKSMDILNKIINEYPERLNQIKILNHLENQGLSMARLTALKEASGEFIAICDSDDWVQPEMYEIMLKKALNENLDIVISDYYISTRNKEKIVDQNIYCRKEEILKKIFTNEIRPYVWNKLIKKELFNKLNPTYSKGLNLWEDVLVIPRLVYYANKIGYINRPLYHYYYNPNSYVRGKWKPEYSNSIIEILQINHNFFKERQIDDTNLMARGLYIVLVNVNKEERNNYINYKKELINKKIDYRIFKSKLRSFLAWCILNNKFFLKDTIYKTLKFLYRN